MMVLTIFSMHVSIGQSYYFRHYQVENGLSNNTVFCSAQDKHGFLWMGTKDGLDRFDGYTFKIFRNDPDDSLSLGDNFIRSICIDANDDLFVGTRNGLYKYNPHTEKFIEIFKKPGEIKDIKKDAFGNLWFVHEKTLIKYNGFTKSTTLFNPNNYFEATSICIDNNKTVWVSTATGLLEKYNPQNNLFTAFDLFAKTKSVSPKWIEKVYATNKNTILVGTSNYGVKSFDIGSNTYKDVLTYNPDKTEIFARDFLQNTENEYWIATESGVFIYNETTQKFTNLKKKFNNPYSISDNAVYSLCKDSEGGIWAGTYFGGINYYPKQYISFEKYLPDYNSTSLSGNAVREICEDSFGDIWIGTEDAGLNKLNPKTGLFMQYKPSVNNVDNIYPNIHGLLVNGNELWIGTYEHGLNIMDIKTGKIIRHFPDSNHPKVFKSNFIITILKTKEGDIFVGTRQGLYRFIEAGNSFQPVSEVPDNCFIHTLLEDKNGNIWIGTFGNGLFYFNPKTNKRSNFLLQPQIKKGITSNFITTIFKDADNGLWIGTEGGGLCKFNPTDSSFQTFGPKDGFPSNTIFKILEDHKKNLWISTSKGLVCFDPATKNIQIYTTSNGLLSDQFNYNSGYKDGSGKMYFGCVKGLISFNPDSFAINNFSPPLIFTAIYVNNKELMVTPNLNPLPQSVLYEPTINLNYDQSSIAIEFAALSFTAPQMTQYKYLMEGLNKDWTYLKTNQRVYFTNLPPGNYVFKINAENSSGVWNEKHTVLIINIKPPFWKSIPAYILYFLLFGLLVYYFFRNYHHRLAEKHERKMELLEHKKEKENYNAKIDFFTNVAHEIKTPLTLIKAPLENIINEGGNSEDASANLKIMERNTDRLIELTTQLLDFRKIETIGFQLNFSRINISELFVERYNSFKAVAEQKKIRFAIQLPSEPIYAFADADSMHKIFNNLFLNAITYAKSQVTATLAMEKERQIFEATFMNDGFLIPSEMKEKIFEPFFRLQETQNKMGSGIGLTLSKSLATLHKGELFVRENDAGMNVFVLRIPS